MKQLFTLFLLFSLGLGLSAQNEEPTGFDGDNFSLEGALELFKNSKSPEDFEKNLNKEDNYINNLDLNQDGKSDYVMVKDNFENDLHAIVLQVAVSAVEIQDIAVIEIEKTGKEKALLQIIGDEDVFGENLIVEPYDIEGESDNKGPNAEMQFVRITVNVWFWPSVRYIYDPAYVIWVSPWRWNYYPRWWNPWRPRAWHVFHPLVIRHHHKHYYHRVHNHRVVNAHKVYSPRRKTSGVVATRTKVTKSKVVVNRQGQTKKVTKSTRTKTRAGKKAVKSNNSGIRNKTAPKAGNKKGSKKTTTKKTRTVKKKKKG